ncbi:hypothetical protein WME88_34340 [Sorangium sp. So ce216]
MDVFVVVTNYMGATQDVRVFSSQDAAQGFVDAASPSGNPVIRRCTVVGEVASPGIVFTASWYDRSSDLHHFRGVYGTSHEAKTAVGEHGMILERNVDEA